MVLASDRHQKDSNIPYVCSRVADVERMRPNHWKESLLYVSFSAFTLSVGFPEGHAPAHKTTCVTDP